MPQGPEGIFIIPEILAALEGQTLFYPAAGRDWSELLDVFENYVGEFRFSDITYNLEHCRKSPFTQPKNYKLLKSEITGNPSADMELRTFDDGGTYRFLKPGHLSEVYERVADKKRLTVIRRRGFGQYALGEIEDKSLAFFVHRGDSPGECGSNVYFLSNKKARHEPCSNLFDKIATKLSDRALVITDGSNTDFKFLRKHHHSQILSQEAFLERRKRQYNFLGFN